MYRSRYIPGRSRISIHTSPATSSLIRRPCLSPAWWVEQKEGEGDGGEEEHSQTDEEDMGMSYKELGDFGRLRKISR